MQISCRDFLLTRSTLCRCHGTGDLYSMYTGVYYSSRILSNSPVDRTQPTIFRIMCDENSLLSAEGMNSILYMNPDDAWSVGYNFVDHGFPKGSTAFAWAQSLLRALAELHPPRGIMELYPCYPFVITGPPEWDHPCDSHGPGPGAMQ